MIIKKWSGHPFKRRGELYFQSIIIHRIKPPLGGLGVKNQGKKEVWVIKPKRVLINPPLGGWGLKRENVKSPPIRSKMCIKISFRGAGGQKPGE